MKNSHEVTYKIHGHDMQFVQVELDPNETVVAEAGAMMMMDDGIELETIFGDGSQQSGGLFGKLVGAGKRLVTGESLFMTSFTNRTSSLKTVSFSSPYPGTIIPLDLHEYGNKIICQKDSFLAAAKGTSVGIEFRKKLSTGLFGGEGFIMQKLEGDGLAFLHAGGSIYTKTLQPGEKIKIDTGCIVGFTGNVNYEIEYVGNVKTALFGGEGLFFATLQGPGTIWVQSLTLARLASRIGQYLPNSSKEEGSILGGLGNLLDGKE
ncbi:TIGR00266 family protein [Bacillus sp. AFS017336]|uniref:TIGR00266 family protein n=1 Tax=Bacillus sp. AFS017336 TaxID=2033489 RepID=UPI000BEFF3C2|nr:TIGR00266 family protein [Bacillus sp. AFS017336]PEK99566.1 TIGR00266 family protein [Bacillus sp. AFS017336]